MRWTSYRRSILRIISPFHHITEEQQFGNLSLWYTCMTYIQTTFYTGCPEKKNKMFFVISSTKLGPFWYNLVQIFLSKFAAKRHKRFPRRLNNESTLPCETLNVYLARSTIELLQKKNSSIYPYSSVASNFARFQFSWLQPVGTIAKKVFKTRIWTNWNSDWEQCGPSWITSLLLQPFVSGLVDSFRSVSFSDACYLYLPLQYLPHVVINSIQIWRICRP